jgi:hypothetical protein
MRRFDSGPVIRQRMLRLKKRKNVLRRQQSLREKMWLSNYESEDQLTDIQEPPAGTESATKQDQ